MFLLSKVGAGTIVNSNYHRDGAPMKDLLSDAIDAYARFRASQDYSRNTLQIEKSVMKRFLSVNGNIYCHSITPRHVERHFEEASKVRSPASSRTTTLPSTGSSGGHGTPAGCRWTSTPCTAGVGPGA